MNRLVVVAFTVAMSGCLPPLSPAEMAPPKRSAFPTRELAFKVHGSAAQVRDTILEELNRVRLQYTQEVSAPYTYVITVYTRERSDSGTRRVRRASYMVRLAPDSDNPQCADVALNWIVESRGIHEENWSTQPEDDQYAPSLRDAFAQRFEQRRCK